MDQISIRQYFAAQDKPFVTNSWLKSFQGESSFTEDMPHHIYYRWHGEIINRILSRSTTTVFIAASRDDSDVILGYLVTEMIRDFHIAHYVYVKRSCNGLGVCKMLFESMPEKVEYASHITRSGKPIIEKLRLSYCPYFIFV